MKLLKTAVVLLLVLGVSMRFMSRLFHTDTIVYTGDEDLIHECTKKLPKPVVVMSNTEKKALEKKDSFLYNFTITGTAKGRAWTCTGLTDAEYVYDLKASLD